MALGPLRAFLKQCAEDCVNGSSGEPDLGSIGEKHLRDVVARADMERYPTPPNGISLVKIRPRGKKEGSGSVERSHYWKPSFGR